MRRSDEALNYLLHAIQVEGREFPDAAPEAARIFRVNYEKLKAAYDEYYASEALNDWNYVGSKYHY